MPAAPRSGTVRVRARWDDADRFGHVNNAAYLPLLRSAHDAAGLPAGGLVALDIVYRSPIDPGAEVDVAWETGPTEGSRLEVRYALSVDGQTAAEAAIGWEVAPAEVREPVLSSALPPPERDVRGRPFRFGQSVRSYELGPSGGVRPQVILQWLEHAVFRAAVRSGWDRPRMEAAGFVTLVIGHRLLVHAPAGEDEPLEVTSRLVELRRVSGVWHHEIRREDGSLVAEDRARGAFLDLDGAIRPAPPEMLERLLGGELDSTE